MKVRFTPQARAQFLGALDYILRDSPTAAQRFRKQAETGLRRLVRYPESARRVPEFPDLPFCEVIVAPYRFFYRTEGKVSVNGALMISSSGSGYTRPSKTSTSGGSKATPELKES